MPFSGGFIKKDYKYNMYLGASCTCPLYIFDGRMEAQGNMRRCVTDLVGHGNSSNNPGCTISSRNVPASWRICKKSRSFQSSIGKCSCDTGLCQVSNVRVWKLQCWSSLAMNTAYNSAIIVVYRLEILY